MTGAAYSNDFLSYSELYLAGLFKVIGLVAIIKGIISSLTIIFNFPIN